MSAGARICPFCHDSFRNSLILTGHMLVCAEGKKR